MHCLLILIREVTRPRVDDRSMGKLVQGGVRRFGRVVILGVRNTRAIDGILVLVYVVPDAHPFLKVASEMVKPLVPSSESQVLETDCLSLLPGVIHAEAAPEDVVVAATDVRLLRPSFDLYLSLDVVHTGLQVVDEILLPEMHGRAHVLGAIGRHGMAALPTL